MARRWIFPKTAHVNFGNGPEKTWAERVSVDKVSSDRTPPISNWEQMKIAAALMVAAVPLVAFVPKPIPRQLSWAAEFPDIVYGRKNEVYKYPHFTDNVYPIPSLISSWQAEMIDIVPKRTDGRYSYPSLFYNSYQAPFVSQWKPVFANIIPRKQDSRTGFPFLSFVQIPMPYYLSWKPIYADMIGRKPTVTYLYSSTVGIFSAAIVFPYDPSQATFQPSYPNIINKMPDIRYLIPTLSQTNIFPQVTPTVSVVGIRHLPKRLSHMGHMNI